MLNSENEFNAIKEIASKSSHQNFSGGPVVKISPSNAGGADSVPGGGAKILRPSWPKNIKQEQYCNKFNKGFTNVPHQKTFKIKKIF